MLHIRLAASRALLLAGFVGALGLLAAPVPAQEHGPEAAEGTPIEPPTKRRKPVEVGDTVNLETPAFPTARVGDAFRIRMGSRFLPGGAFDSFDVDLYQPELRLRATAPLSKRAVLQLTGRLGASIYDFDDRGGVLGLGAGDPFDDFYAAVLTLQGGFRLNEKRSLFAEGEVWSLLSALEGRSRWESGAFTDGLTGSGRLAVGYEIEGLIRIAVGVELGSRIDQGGVKLSPVATLKWRVTDRFTVRNRGLGLQLEYAFTDRFEVFTAGFFDRSTFRLNSRPGLPDDLTFKDDAILAGLGFEWKISKHLRLNVEVGAVFGREIRVKSQGLGTLAKERADPGAYLDVRFEIRP